MTLFLDMDGVLADFDKRAHEILGHPPGAYEEKYGSRQTWAELQASPDFYNSFDLMPDAPQLWAATSHLNPIVLTGVPLGDWAGPQKRRWIARHFGQHVRVITCFARDKANHCEPGDVLVDDRTKYADKWRARGGHFVVHSSAERSIAELRRIGVLA